MAEYKGMISLIKVSDGKQGEPGPAADEYRVETNQEEILKFYESDGVVFAPENFAFWLEKEEEKIEQSVLESVELIGNNFSTINLKKYLNNNFIEIDSDLVTEENYKNYYIKQQIEEYIEPIGPYDSEETYYQYDSDNGYTEVESDENIEENYKNYYIKNLVDKYVKPSSYNKDLIYYKEEEINFVKFDDINKFFYLDLDSNSDILQDVTLSNIFKEYEFFLKIKFAVNDKKVIKQILCRFGTKKDSAQFGLYANRITASIQNSKLNFSSEGLEILNGGISVKKASQLEEEEVLYFSEAGNLTIKGNIYADNGYFNGEINTNKGKIGGFIINSNELFTSDSYEYIEVSFDKITQNNYQDYYIKNENGEYSKAEEFNSQLTYYTREEDPTSSPLRLIGSEGRIYAKNIKIGNGAEIENYIELGDDVLICNPSENEGKFIISKNIVLNNNGKLNIGSIEAFGGEGENLAYIKSANEKWKIEANGCAHFEDIYANNVHLSNTILEVGTVQNVGSLMVFKDAWAPVEISEDKKTLTFADLTSLKVEDWIYGSGNDGKAKFYKVNQVEENGKKITLETEYQGEIETPISKFGAALNSLSRYVEVSFGENSQEKFEDFKELYIILEGNYILNEAPYDENTKYYKKLKQDFAFSIFGESEDFNITNKQYPFASSYSITLSDFKEEDNTISFNKRLILGQLDESGVDASGVGLYCDNVFLKGSLIAEENVKDPTYYSGINTLSGVKMPDYIKDEDGNNIAPYFPSPDDPSKSRQTGDILLWAGAKSIDDIANSPFRVDSYGNLYAGSGYFKGSIISEATITAAAMEAARMRTAVLEGWEGNDQPALKIINTEKGIGFGDEILVDGADPQYNEIFSINKTGLKAGKVEFIKIGKGISNTISSNTSANREDFTMGFDNNKLYLWHTTVNNNDLSHNFGFEITKDVESSGTISKGAVKIIKKEKNDKGELVDNDIVTIKEDTSVFKTDMYFNKNINYSTIMKYQQVENGYDLYVN